MRLLAFGTYIDMGGRRRKINMDTSELLYAEGLLKIHKKLLQDLRFRTRCLEGTQEIRTQIGHVMF